MGQANQRITVLEGMVRAQATERQQAMDELAQRFSEDVQSVRNMIIAMEENARRVDASVVPVIG